MTKDKELAKQDELDFGFDLSDMMMMIMMIMMISVLSTLSVSSAQTAQALQAQSFVGNEDPRTLHATNRLQWINLLYDYPHTPWISAYIINDGPSAIEIGINYPDDRFTMNPRETITITRSGAEERIKIVYYVSHPGLRADVRITGVY